MLHMVWTTDLQLKCNWPMLRVTVNTKQALHGGRDLCKDSLNYCFQVFKVFHGARTFGLPCIRRKASLAVVLVMFQDWILGITLAL
jgi:hypothetical protein